MTINKYILLSIICCFCLASSLVVAQNQTPKKKIQVATKKFTQSFKVEEGVKLKIDGEKSNIRIEGWDKPQIDVTIKMTAKHPEKKIVAKEIEYMEYIVEENEKDVYLKNYFSIPARNKPKANMKTEYEVKVPQSSQLDISNYFGNVEMNNLEGDVALKSEYGKVSLEEINAPLSVNTNLSDVKASHLSGGGAINSENSNIDIKEVEGTYKIDNQYGEVHIGLSCEEADFEVNGKKSDVFIQTDDVQKYNYTLENSYGEIQLPDHLDAEVVEDSNKKKKVVSINNEGEGGVKVNTSFGKIMIEE